MNLQTLRVWFDPDAMAAADIYCSIGGLDQVQAVFDDEIASYVSHLCQFYCTAPTHDHAVLLAIT